MTDEDNDEEIEEEGPAKQGENSPEEKINEEIQADIKKTQADEEQKKSLELVEKFKPLLKEEIAKLSQMVTQADFDKNVDMIAETYMKSERRIDALEAELKALRAEMLRARGSRATGTREEGSREDAEFEAIYGDVMPR